MSTRFSRSSDLSGIGTGFKVILRCLVLAELLPSDGVLRRLLVAFKQKVCADRTRYAVDAEVKVAHLLTRKVSLLSKNDLRAARFAHERAAGWLANDPKRILA